MLRLLVMSIILMIPYAGMVTMQTIARDSTVPPHAIQPRDLCARSKFGGNDNLRNLCLDTVRVETFTEKMLQRGEGIQGTGFVASGHNEIVTADHVVHSYIGKKVNKIDVMFVDGRLCRASVVYRDGRSLLALLKFECADNGSTYYHPLKFAPGETKVYTPTVGFGYENHQRTLQELSGLTGSGKHFYDVSVVIRNKSAPDANLEIVVPNVYMHVAQGLSGAAIASQESGSIVGVLQFGINASRTKDGQLVSGEGLATPSRFIEQLLNDARHSVK